MPSSILSTKQIGLDDSESREEKSKKRNTPTDTAEPLLDQNDLKGKAIKLMNTTPSYFPFGVCDVLQIRGNISRAALCGFAESNAKSSIALSCKMRGTLMINDN